MIFTLKQRKMNEILEKAYKETMISEVELIELLEETIKARKNELKNINLFKCTYCKALNRSKHDFKKYCSVCGKPELVKL